MSSMACHGHALPGHLPSLPGASALYGSTLGFLVIIRKVSISQLIVFCVPGWFSICILCWECRGGSHHPALRASKAANPEVQNLFLISHHQSEGKLLPLFARLSETPSSLPPFSEPWHSDCCHPSECQFHWQSAA